jgi:single-stranded-DNA-specific exonuclease
VSGAFLGVERSIKGKAWRLRLADERLGLALAQQHRIPEIVGRVLAGRGVSCEDCERFLNPTLRTWLPDPSRFKDMDRAAERVTAAICAGEPIAIFGDYDVDGATSAALLQRFLRTVGANVRIYIPNRQREGYGPNAPAMLRLGRDGVRLIVTVDCGTVAHAPLAEAAEAGLEVIVVDHHLAEPRLPLALAIVNPNRLDEEPGYGQVAAVGVTFLLAVAVNRALRRLGWYAGERSEPNLLQWLDLVALGTVADVVPLTGLNRALVGQGIKVLAGRGNLGLAALCDVAQLSEPPGSYHLGFVLGPRVNAGGRVGKADLGARLLTTEDPAEARELATALDVLNRERQAIEAEVLRAALEHAASQGNRSIAVVAGEGWHPGVIGIVAGRLKDRLERPALVVALENGIGKGSGRSVAGVDLGAAVTAARQAGLLINGGGHPMAAGLTVAAERLDALSDFLETRIAPQLGAGASGPILGLDGALSPAGATPDLIDLLGRAGPYGAGHAEPRFAVPAARVVRADPAGDSHLRVVLTGAGGGRLRAVLFRERHTEIGQALTSVNGPLHVAGHLRADRWQGETRVQLVIEDAAPAR